LRAAALIEALNGALAEEIACLRNEGGRPLVVLNGVLVYQGQEGYLKISKSYLILTLGT